MPSSSDITRLLLDWSNGDAAALQQLMPLVEAELHRLARSYMRKEKPTHTLQTTALVNEAYLRLVNQRKVKWQNRAHFFGISAQFMRRILLDHAKMHRRSKRGSGPVRVSLSEARGLSAKEADDLLEFNEALERLSQFDARKSQVVELRYFGGMSVEEVAEYLRVSEVTVMRDWSLAKTWLRRELGHGS